MRKFRCHVSLKQSWSPNITVVLLQLIPKSKTDNLNNNNNNKLLFKHDIKYSVAEVVVSILIK